MRRRLTVSPVPVMWRPNTSEWALRGRLGAVAERGLRQEPGARSFSGDGRHQRSRGSRAMIREAFLPKKSHPATLAVVEHANGIMHWLECAMHDPLAQPPAFSHLLHNQPPERQKQVAGSRSRGAYLGEVRWFVLVLGPFWRAARQRQWGPRDVFPRLATSVRRTWDRHVSGRHRP
jgi:hypothetical protein